MHSTVGVSRRFTITPLLKLMGVAKVGWGVQRVCLGCGNLVSFGTTNKVSSVNDF